MTEILAKVAGQDDKECAMQATTTEPIARTEQAGDAPTNVHSSVQTIGPDELTARIDSQADGVLVMAMDQRRFEIAHIPGSISFDAFIDLEPELDRTADIVIYCTNAACVASRLRAAYLAELGFTSVARFAGGLAEWTGAGRPIETGPGTQALS